MKRLPKIIILILYSITCSAQGNRLVDSLKQALKGNTDSIEVNILNRISYELSGDDNAGALKHARQALEISKNINYKKGVANANYNLGLTENFQGNYAQALELLKKALGDYTQLNDKEGIANASNSIGVIYETYSLYDKALENYLLALKIYEELNVERGKANCYNNIALIYHNQNRYKESLEYQRKALKLDLKNKKTDDAAISYLNIADMYMDMGEYNKALSYSDSVIPALVEANYKYALSNAYSLFAGIYYKIGNYPKSLDLYKKANTILKEVNYTSGIAINHTNIAEVYYKIGNVDVALDELNKSLALQDRKTNNEYLAETYNLLSEIYRSKGDYKKALEYYKEYSKKIDAIQENKMSEKLLSYQTLYETEAKENQIKLLNKENELKESRINHQFYVILVIILACLLLGLLAMTLYIRNRNRKRNNEILMGQNLEIQKQKEAIEQQNITLENQAKQLKAQDELKTNFFSNISHEFRTPLTLILGPLQSLQEKTIDQSQKEQFNLIQRNALRLQQLINQLLDISRIEKGFVGLKLTKDDICEYIRYLVSSFHSHAIDRNINLTLETSTPNFIALFDKDKVEKIFFNLLSNAFKYTPNGGSIEVTLTITDKIALSIADTGIGIAKEKIPYIFDKYYQADSTVVKTYESTGIGLALTKELVDIHLGTINVDSRPGKGSTFTVEIPLNYDGFEYNIAQENTIPGESIEFTDSNAPTAALPKTDYSVLVIDDNDDMRKFIISNLNSEYEVYEASNGKLGVDKALEIVPDIIISDVMMPEMDGFEVTRTLKNDKRTSHIPVILLTARSTIESKITGLEAEADDYLTKPFYIKELKIRMGNILKNRQKLRELFGNSINISPSEITVSSLDEQFIAKALEVVEKNMDNPDFDIEEFCDQVGMSRTNLHRKLKAITNKSATEFIRSLRIKRAAQLLKQKAGTVSDIAYMVGFNNLSYFTRCFKEDIGVNPSEYN